MRHMPRNKMGRIRMHRHAAAGLCVLLLPLLLLSGCSGAVRQPAATAATGNGIEATPVRSDLPRRDLVICMPGNIQKDHQLVNDEINKILLERLNCTLTIKMTDWNLWSSKYPVLISSSDQMDMMFTASYFAYLQEVAKNTFLPLDDLLAEYGRDIPGVMVGGYLDAAKVKGKLYAIPVNKDTGQGWGVVANQDMAEELGVDFDDVHHLEDLEPILAKAREGLPKTVTPLFLSTDLSMTQIMGSTQACDNIGMMDRSRFVLISDFIFYDMQTHASMPVSSIPEYLDQCRLVRNWFKAGYINDNVTTTQMTSREAMMEGKAFMHVQAQSPIHKAQWENETGKRLLTVEFIRGIKETQSMTGSMTALPRQCTDPERAMMVINQFWTDSVLKNLFTWGIEGTHYVRVKDNIIRLPDGMKSAEQTGYNPGNFWHFGNAYLLNVWENEDPRKWSLLRQYCDEMPESPLLGFSFDTWPVRQELLAFTNHNTELMPLLANGVLDTDEILLRINQKDRSTGIDRICAELDRQIEAWLREKGRFSDSSSGTPAATGP